MVYVIVDNVGNLQKDGKNCGKNPEGDYING
jgi:hypothetical protein